MNKPLITIDDAIKAYLEFLMSTFEAGLEGQFIAKFLPNNMLGVVNMDTGMFVELYFKHDTWSMDRARLIHTILPVTNAERSGHWEKAA
jgi:hypothetical protein